MTGADGRVSTLRLITERGQNAQEIILVVRGELDLATTEQLEQAVGDAVSAGAARIVVDLTELQFIDSSGLMALIRGRQSVGSIGGLLILRNVPRQAKRVFELTRTADLFAT